MEVKHDWKTIEWPKKLSCTITILIPQSGTILFLQDDIIIATASWNNVDAANRGAASIQWTRRS